MEQIVEVNGARLWTARQGSGPPLVLLHGGPGLWDDFGPLAAMIDDLVEVHRYDQRGSGRSGGGPPYDLATFVADIEALRAHWGHERWIVGGHSAGANLALAYTLAHPQRVQAILYCSGTGVIDDWHDEYHANAASRRTSEQQARYNELRRLLKETPDPPPFELWNEYALLTFLPDFANRARATELARSLLRPYPTNRQINAVQNAEWSALLADGSYAARVSGITAPMLVLHGAEDPRPPRLAARLAASLANTRISIIPAAGHIPWLERTQETRTAVRQFLSDLTLLKDAGAAIHALPRD